MPHAACRMPYAVCCMLFRLSHINFPTLRLKREREKDRRKQDKKLGVTWGAEKQGRMEKGEWRMGERLSTFYQPLGDSKIFNWTRFIPLLPFFFSSTGWWMFFFSFSFTGRYITPYVRSNPPAPLSSPIPRWKVAQILRCLASLLLSFATCHILNSLDIDNAAKKEGGAWEFPEVWKLKQIKAKQIRARPKDVVYYLKQKKRKEKQLKWAKSPQCQDEAMFVRCLWGECCCIFEFMHYVRSRVAVTRLAVRRLLLRSTKQ